MKAAAQKIQAQFLAEKENLKRQLEVPVGEERKAVVVKGKERSDRAASNDSFDSHEPVTESMLAEEVEGKASRLEGQEGFVIEVWNEGNTREKSNSIVTGTMTEKGQWILD